MPDEFAESYLWDIDIKRPCRMVLNPLAEVVIGVFMTVGVGGGQFVMDVLGNCKRGKRQQQKNETDRQAGSQPINETLRAHAIH